jgi:hypothetical protein
MHRSRSLVIVAAIAHIYMCLAEAAAGQVLDLLDLRFQRVAIERGRSYSLT